MVTFGLSHSVERVYWGPTVVVAVGWEGQEPESNFPSPLTIRYRTKRYKSPIDEFPQALVMFPPNSRKHPFS
ncbi:MAG: hypothetical protein ACMG6H_09780, partial [Acidobacteriota bacterium]